MSAAHSKTSKRKERFLSEVKARRTRHEEHVREGDTSFWQSVGVMGTIGWSVSAPMVLGIFLGRWIDRQVDSAHVFTIFCLLCGLITGCVTAWRIVSEKL